VGSLPVSATGEVELIPVLPNHRFDEDRLAQYLLRNLAGFSNPLEVRQFQGGQSNPTYLLQTPGASYVLRKKPAGKLLPSAHAIEREFTVMRALAGSDVPVPRVLLLCSDPGIIGQSFYVMQHIEGRVFTDRLLPGCSPADRAAMYGDMNWVLAALHRVDYRAIGLADFGRSDAYALRQVRRWTRQYVESKVVDVPAMDRLLDWLPAHVPAADEAAIAHGDFRIGNLIFHPTQPRVAAVLDWELATVGHPLADLAYNCLAYRLPYLGGRGFGAANLSALGIPAELDYIEQYRCRVGRACISDWEFFVVLALFRTASILVGVHRRAIIGNAAAVQTVGPQLYSVIAERAWELAQRASG
jgi:aminoglycoside phosphotransferase (APT) family kinase protein